MAQGGGDKAWGIRGLGVATETKVGGSEEAAGGGVVPMTCEFGGRQRRLFRRVCKGTGAEMFDQWTPCHGPMVKAAWLFGTSPLGFADKYC